MTVFDTLRFPVSRYAIVYDGLLEKLPLYLVRRWWYEVMIQYKSDYRYRGEDLDHMKNWVFSLNDKRLEPHLYRLRTIIANWDT